MSGKKLNMFRRKSDSVMPKDAESATPKVRGPLSGFERARCVTVSGALRMCKFWEGRREEV